MKSTVFLEPILDQHGSMKIISSTAFIFCITLFLCYPAFLPERFYPLVPIIEGFDLFIQPVQAYLFLVFIALLLFGIFRMSRLILSLLLIIFALFVLADYNRLQPYFYQYCLIFLIFLSQKEGKVMGLVRLLLFCTYFFSGLHKLNPNFELHIVPFLLRPFVSPLIPFYPYLIKILAIIIPLVEMTAGLGLIIRNFNKYAIYTLLIVHVIILFVMAPSFMKGFNLTILPWNIQMIYMLLILLKYDFSFYFNLKKFIHLAYFTLLFILPMTSFWGFWDKYLSFNLYSGKLLYAKVIAPSQEILDNKLLNYAKAMPDGTSKIELFTWCHDELGLLPYPEKRVYRGVFDTLKEDKSLPKTCMLVFH